MIAEQRITDVENMGKSLHNGKREDLVRINDVAHDTTLITVEVCRGFNVMESKLDILINRKPKFNAWQSVTTLGVFAGICVTWLRLCGKF